jgi:16S rRNA (adenine1518-N6/adenine1519-N6)-dimethyltransferase
MTTLPSPRKRFGQHFLHDPNILQKIIAAISASPNDHFVEIGPGRGALTAALLSTGVTLDAVEIDRDLVTYLQQTFAHDKKFSVHQADVLEFNFSSLITHQQKLRIIGNLPYNISTPLLFKLFACLNHIQDMYFMLQKEVVLRLTAPVGDSVYNRLSVMSQYFCDCTLLFNVSANSFSPPPKVESAFVRLVPHQTLTDAHFETFSAVVKEAFTYRRKTLANSLKRLVSAEQLKSIGIDPQARAQELTVADFVKISNIKR